VFLFLGIRGERIFGCGGGGGRAGHAKVSPRDKELTRTRVRTNAKARAMAVTHTGHCSIRSTLRPTHRDGLAERSVRLL